MRRAVAALFACCLGAAVASCGGGASQPASSSSGSCSAGTAAVNLGSADSTVQATDNLTFMPQSISAAAGKVVQWTNMGSTQHTITFGGASASCLSDSLLQAGSTWSVRFTQPGTYMYTCQIHPQMTGTITVQ